jgi:hypothetical protein
MMSIAPFMMQIRRGVPQTSVTSTTPTILYQIPIGRKARISKVIAFNSGAAAVNLIFFSVVGATATQILPPISIGAGALVTLTEDQLPAIYIASTAVNPAAIAAALSAAGSVSVAIEVVEE